MDEKIETLDDDTRTHILKQWTMVVTGVMGKQCFRRCVPKAGTKLDKNERICLAKCSDRFMESWGLVYTMLASLEHDQDE